MKARTLYPENITKTFRKFSGEVSLQIDGEQWIELRASQKADMLLKARNAGQLLSVTIDEDLNIIDLEIDKYKNVDPDLLTKVKNIYRHG